MSMPDISKLSIRELPRPRLPEIGQCHVCSIIGIASRQCRCVSEVYPEHAYVALMLAMGIVNGAKGDEMSDALDMFCDEIDPRLWHLLRTEVRRG